MAVTENLRSWLVLFAVTYVYFLENGLVKGLGVLLPDLKEQLGSETWIIGSCISIMIIWGYMLGLSANSLKKKFGARFCLIGSSLVTSVGLIICAYATSVHTFLIGIILMGFVLLHENIAMGIVPEYFDRYYTIAVNVYGLGAGLAVLIFPILVQTLRDIYGWRGALLLLSGLSFQTIVFSTIVNNSKSLTETKTSSLSSYQATQMTKHGTGLVKTFLNKLDVNLIGSVPFLARVVVPATACGCVWTAWLIYIVSFAFSTGMSLKQASLIATCGGAGTVGIKIALPFISQFATYRQLTYVSALMMALPQPMPIFFPTVVGLCISSILLCMGVGMASTEIYIAVKDTCHENQYVSGIAWYHLFYGIGGLSGAFAIGLVFDVTRSFNVSFILLSVVSMVTVLSLGLEDIWIKYRDKLNQKDGHYNFEQKFQ